MVTKREGAGVTASSTGTLKAQQLRYFQQDHLGSTAIVTDEAGQVVERLAYDPWGKRRFANGLADKLDQIVPITTDRGYTEHEHLDEVGVIHMNGRVYDPLVGRFMSADPFIQAPYELQSHNRYAYVMNNPLHYADPSGYFSLKSLVKTVVVIAVVVYTGGAAASAAASAMGYTSVAAATIGAGATIGSAMAVGAAAGFAGSFMSSAMMGGNLEQSLKAGVTGAITGAAFAGISYGINSYASGLDSARYNSNGSVVLTNGQRTARAVMQSGFVGLNTRLQGGNFAAGMRGSLGILGLAEMAGGMRQSMIDDSAKNPANMSGASEGWQGDGYKIGGGRVDASEYAKYGASAVADVSPMGGAQGGPGYMALAGGYSPGSFGDRLVEAYSGPHDYFNSWTYDSNGNYAPPTGMTGLANVGNYVNVLTATPFVTAATIQAYTPSLLYRRK